MGSDTTATYDLRAVPIGTVAHGDGFLLLPLADGESVRVELGGDSSKAGISVMPGLSIGAGAAFGGGTVAAGPRWRSPGVDAQAIGHIVHLDGDDYLLTDGSRGLARIPWPSAKIFQPKEPVKLEHRIIAAPAVLAGDAKSRPRICVADASDTVTLLDERLAVLRGWPLAGKITAGPWVRGPVIVCVVDTKRIVGIDPDRDEPWQYAMASAVVGEPQLIDGMLVVADASGRFVALDPKTGSPLGPGYTLRANVAPESAPVPFGPGRLLVPLSDGTLLLLPLAKLRDGKAA